MPADARRHIGNLIRNLWLVFWLVIPDFALIGSHGMMMKDDRGSICHEVLMTLTSWHKYHEWFRTA